MQSHLPRFIRSFASPVAVLTAGLLLAAPLHAAHAGDARSPMAVASVADVARWSDSVWNAAKSGDSKAVEEALRNVPESSASADAARLRERIASRTEHADEGGKTRDADREKALEEMRKEMGAGELTKALTSAVKMQTLSDDWAAALALPEMKELVPQAETGFADASAKGEWLSAQEIMFRLRTLFEESGDATTFRRYDAQLDEVNKRVMLLAQYAPRELYRLRKEYAARVDPGKPFPEFNEAFADDWKEALDGISKGMLTSALTTAANDHISSGGWEPLVKGGLESIRLLATTSALSENFEGMKDPAKTQMLAEAAVRNLEGLARVNRDTVGKPQYNAALRDILAANQAGPQLPDSIVIREFGDGAIDELSKRFEDEYTQIIWPDQLRRFEQMVKGNFVGVGILIRHDDRRDIQVINPLEGGPAFRGGIENDDRIVAVDGKSTVGWTLNKAVDSITGPAGEDVKLTVRREGAEQPVDVVLKREEIKIRSVNGWWKKGLDTAGNPLWDWYVDADAGIGYVRLTSFNEDSFADFMDAVDFSNAFLERGRIVSGQDRNGGQVWQMMAEPSKAVYKDMPIVVLVNQGSASASEIVSGALKAHDRAVVLGERSFGKGSVQTVHPCGDARSDAQIKLTTQYYVLPPGPGETQGRLVHKRPGATDWGVNPDIIVKMTPDQIEKSVTLRQNADVIEAKKADPKPRPDVTELLTKGIDPQLEYALVLLQARALKELDEKARAMTDAAPASTPTQGG
ncbi:MAG: S41 family peptidase [Planctomycetaceae bacterium]|nr:S41 family peptidase [Planctomycetaceae bacterium]